MSKLLIIIGFICIIIGLLYAILKKLGLGQLPGDIWLSRGGVSFYFPVMSCIIISIVITLIIKFFNR